SPAGPRTCAAAACSTPSAPTARTSSPTPRRTPRSTDARSAPPSSTPNAGCSTSPGPSTRPARSPPPTWIPPASAPTTSPGPTTTASSTPPPRTPWTPSGASSTTPFCSRTDLGSGRTGPDRAGPGRAGRRAAPLGGVEECRIPLCHAAPRRWHMGPRGPAPPRRYGPRAAASGRSQLPGAVDGLPAGLGGEILELREPGDVGGLRHLGVQEREVGGKADHPQGSLQVGLLVVGVVAGGSGAVGATAGGRHDDSLPGQRAPAGGRVRDQRRDEDPVEPGLERRGDREVVHRHAEHDRVGGEEFLHQRPGHVPAGLLLRRRRYAAGLVQVPDPLPLQPVHDLDLRRVDVRDGFGGEVPVGVGAVRTGPAPGVRELRGDLSRDRLPARTGIDVQQRRHAENPVSSDRGSSTDVPRPLNKPHRAMSRILA